MKSWCVTIQMKATEQYFPVVLFIMPYKVIVTFESVDEILMCDYSNESYWALLSCAAVYYAVQGGSIFWVSGWNPKLSVTIQMKATEQYFPVVLFMLYKVILSFESVDEILMCDHWNESYWAVLSCGAVYAVQNDSIFWVSGWNPDVWPFKWKLLSSTFLWCCLLCCTRWFYLLGQWMKS